MTSKQVLLRIPLVLGAIALLVVIFQRGLDVPLPGSDKRSDQDAQAVTEFDKPTAHLGEARGHDNRASDHWQETISTPEEKPDRTINEEVMRILAKLKLAPEEPPKPQPFREWMLQHGPAVDGWMWFSKGEDAETWEDIHFRIYREPPKRSRTDLVGLPPDVPPEWAFKPLDITEWLRYGAGEGRHLDPFNGERFCQWLGFEFLKDKILPVGQSQKRLTPAGEMLVEDLVEILNSPPFQIQSSAELKSVYPILVVAYEADRRFNRKHPPELIARRLVTFNFLFDFLVDLKMAESNPFDGCRELTLDRYRNQLEKLPPPWQQAAGERKVFSDRLIVNEKSR